MFGKKRRKKLRSFLKDVLRFTRIHTNAIWAMNLLFLIFLVESLFAYLDTTPQETDPIIRFIQSSGSATTAPAVIAGIVYALKKFSGAADETGSLADANGHTAEEREDHA